MEKFIPLIVVMLIQLISTIVILVVVHIKNLKTAHKKELHEAKHDSFNHGWNEGRKSLPMVQHCSSKTNYEFIRHQWDPAACVHCNYLLELMGEV